jgi:MFS transporter, FHS family, glucose/mannose:H+ symporter
MNAISPEPVTIESGTLSAVGARKALAGFFVSGLLLAFLGAILPSWGHHVSSDYSTIAWYFVGMIAGLVGSVWIAPPLLAQRGIGWTLAFACGLSSAAFVYLAFVSPPFATLWRVAGLAVIGLAAGVLHTAIFHAISPMYRHDPAATINLAGILFGLGCLTVALLISGTFYMYTAGAILAWIAVIPALFGWFYVRARFAADTDRDAVGLTTSQRLAHQPPLQAIFAELRSPGAVLFSLVLFFQFGNEWAIAGWLPLFLSQRLGISPATSLLMLALYWFALLIGRVAAQWILPRARHGRILLGSVLAAMLGCLLLMVTDNQSGAMIGILLIGGAFAPIYPLVVEKIGHRFPSYHPGFYNGIFSLAIAGGLLAPCTLGYFASVWGVRVVMGLPLAGSAVVFVLLMLISLEARLGASSGR